MATQIGKKLETLRRREEGEEALATGNPSWVDPILGPRRLEKTPIGCCCCCGVDQMGLENCDWVYCFRCLVVEEEDKVAILGFFKVMFMAAWDI